MDAHIYIRHPLASEPRTCGLTVRYFSEPRDTFSLAAEQAVSRLRHALTRYRPAFGAVVRNAILRRRQHALSFAYAFSASTSLVAGTQCGATTVGPH
jgi:hypothetical protein